MKKDRADDAFGQMLWDYWRGDKEVTEIIERDDGYIRASIFGPAVYLAPYRKWYESEKRAIRYVKGRVLDVGCGAGRHALYLQERGMDVLGIDTSPLALRVCRERGLKKTRLLSFAQVSELPRQTFDTVLMLGHNFGLFGSFRRAQSLLRKLHRITTSRSRIIATTLDPHRTKVRAHRAYHRWNRSRGRMAGQIRLRVRHRNFIGPWFDYRPLAE